VREIQARVNIAAVRLARANSALLNLPTIPTYNWEMDITGRIGGRKAPEGEGYIQVVAGVDVVARPGAEAGGSKLPDAATISCDFGIDYFIQDSEFYKTINDADVLRFGSLNGMYNAWPYMRAHCQAVAAAMMIPLVIPTFRPDTLFPDLARTVEEKIKADGRAL